MAPTPMPRELGEKVARLLAPQVKARRERLAAHEAGDHHLCRDDCEKAA